jgi:hypothetical protein
MIRIGKSTRNRKRNVGRYLTADLETKEAIPVAPWHLESKSGFVSVVLDESGDRLWLCIDGALRLRVTDIEHLSINGTSVHQPIGGKTMTHIHQEDRFPKAAFERLTAADAVYQTLVARAAELSAKLLAEGKGSEAVLALEEIHNAIGARAAVLAYGLGTTLSAGMTRIMGQLLALGFKSMEVVEHHLGMDSDEYRHMAKLTGTIITDDLLTHFRHLPAVVWTDAGMADE